MNRFTVFRVGLVGVAAALTIPLLAHAGDPAPESIVAALRRGEAVEVLVDFDSLSIDGEAIEMARARGRRYLGAEELTYKRSGLRALKQSALDGVEGVTILSEYENLSSSFVRIENEVGLNTLLARPEVLRVHENARAELLTTESLPLINQSQVAAEGIEGAGKTIVIIDSGVDYEQSYFGCTSPGAGCRVVDVFESEGSPGDGQLDSLGHGTLVSAIAASVAPGATLAVADFIDDGDPSGNVDGVQSAINWAICLKSGGTLMEGTPEEIHCVQRDVAAINMSFAVPHLPGSPHNAVPCPTASLAGVLADAMMASIQPITASGNFGYFTDNQFHDGIVSPACIPGVVSVGAVYDADNLGPFVLEAYPLCEDQETVAGGIACWSQTASFLSLLAPGALIDVSGVTNLSEQHAGTSFAAPHVAGAWAVMAAAMPGASNAEILSALQQGGKPVEDSRLDPPRTTPRIDLKAALDLDSDSVLYPFDNCTDKPNAAPKDCDADNDGYGNMCDCDLDNSGGCNTSDIPPFYEALNNNLPKGDINCDGTTNTGDIPPFKTLLMESDPSPPGPSGYPCAGTIPCP